VISGFCREVDENYSLLGYYAASGGNFLPTFRNNLSVPSSASRIQKEYCYSGKSKQHQMFVYVCISALCFVGRYCLHFEVTERSQVDAELIRRKQMYWLYWILCGGLACHSYERGKTRKVDHHFINNCSENTGGSDMVYFVLLITENMDIEATSLSDVRSRSSNVVLANIYRHKNEWHPTVIRLSAHLEKGVHVYLAEQIALQRIQILYYITLLQVWKECS
jgi:hypothetical protein